MDVQSGKGTNAKVIQYELLDNDSNYKLIELSQRHRQALIASCVYLRWMSRHSNLPSDLITNDLLDAWVSDLELRLMTDIDFCARMILCLDEDEDVQDAVARLIDRITNGTGLVPGKKQTEEALNRDLVEGTNPTCDKDILYSQCYELIGMTHNALMDFFQKVAVAANATEFVENTWNSLPLLGVIDDALGINGLYDTFQYFVNGIGEGYEGQFTETPGGTKDRLAYDLFCACSIDCNITIARITRMLGKRLAVYVSPPSLSGLVNFLEQLFLIAQDSSFIVDLFFYTAWGLVDVAGFLMGVRFDRLLETVVRMQANEPNDDWIALEAIFGVCPNCEITNTILEGTEVL